MINWQKLFENRERLFWTLHTGGWAGFAIVYYIGSFLHDVRGIWIFVIALNAMAGWLLTIPLRYIYRWAHQQTAWKMLLTVAVSAYFIALFWAVLKNINYWEIYKHGYRPEAWFMYFTNTINSLIMVVCWSGLYFGIKNFQMLQKEKQNALKASTMAHQAHLKMLRYQLNPHFLFNTLNAISTLILIKDNKTAEAMVSRLSDFLRYSLDKDPIKKISLKHEIQALELYLEIEKVRFDDRLDVEWDIAEDCNQALVPSLILQPIIENAIKYAISKMEKGGKIKVVAKSFGRDLMLEVSDNGPGANIENGQLNRSNGVGLPNIQERLNSLYSNNFSYVVSHNQPTGIKVSIRIPFEVNEHDNQN
ncbi:MULTISPECIES: sensor histidine kinase [Alteromonadaceae]|uniref:sensor histidine kinase n=1 Tax=Alteromonadaceae TaxID=72275 RepID=UPI001C08547D|nr:MULTISPECIES: histidine kinase [Aliiglaciecola]MBU2877351.1 histidine kinase [Aliiglaciecola lipolytica]MDO6712999.1 histidine kinase [Aliiglaciecola sp. 2_MG-2023]MDO6754038.1 histidine kinase [Aliiglaciecola sp. 1_MG-2023]